MPNGARYRKTGALAWSDSRLTRPADASMVALETHDAKSCPLSEART